MASLSTPDLCIVGAGSSGLAAAEAARRLGASVVVVEPAEPGGSRHRSGPLALRALAASAEAAFLARRAPQFGVAVDPPDVSIRKVHDHVAGVALLSAKESNVARLAAADIHVVRAAGVFADARTLVAGDVEIRAKKFIIATGTRPVAPDIAGLSSVPFFTTETIFDNTKRLDHLLILGAGPMGLELALAYRRFGSTVTVVETGKLLAHADSELAAIGLRRLVDEGVVLHEDASVIAVQSRPESIGVALRLSAGESVTLDVSHILVAGTRVANLDDLGLPAARVRRAKLDPAALALSAAFRTSNPRIFAIGEAAGRPPMPHLAAIEADLVVRAAILGQQVRIDAAAMPRLTLTDPELAEIGLTEPMARQRFKSAFTVLRLGYDDNGKARARRDGLGLVKLIVGPAGKILGAGVVGRDAGELLALFALAMQAGIPVARLASLPAAYASHADLARALGAMAAVDIPASRPERWRLALKRLFP